jgi:peptide/nickel transport system substrate-binding protein
VPISYGLDPHLEQGGGLPVIARAYGYLFHVDSRDDSLILDHATSVEQPEPGVYVIQLGARRFHQSSPANGRAVTADDALLSMRRYRDHPLVTSKFWHTKMLGDHGASADGTILLRTARPYVYSLHEMGHINAGALLPREAVESQADIRSGVSGSGPMLIAAASTAAEPQLARFDGYEPPALVDAMRWRVFDAVDQAAAAFRDGAIDVWHAGDRGELAAFDSDGINAFTEPGLSWTSVGWRVDRPPFADERVRRAIDMAIDRQALLSDASSPEGDIVGPVNGHLANGYWSLTRDEIVRARGGDLASEERTSQARALLDAAGVGGATIEMQVAETPELLDLAALVRQQLLPFRIDVTVVSLPLAAWFFNLRAGNFHATLINHSPYETPDASLRLYHSQGQEGTGNPFAFMSPAIDWLVEKSWAEDDRAQRQSTVRDAQRLMIEARPMVHLFSGTSYAVTQSYVRDSGLDLPGSLARYHYRQWLDRPPETSAD